MIQQIVKWVWLGIVLLFILSGLLYGAGRGLRKTLFRGGWLIITALLLFFLVGPLVDLILGFDLSTFGVELSVNEGTVKTLKEFFTTLICDSTGIANTAENAAAIADILQVVKLFLNVILFIILFIVLKWILYPLFALLYRLFFKGKAQKQYKKDLKAYKKACKNLKRVEANGFASGSDPEFEETITPIKPNQSYKDIIAAVKQRKLEEAKNAQNANSSEEVTAEPVKSKNIESSSPTTTKVEEPEMADNSFVEDKIVETKEEKNEEQVENPSNLNNVVTTDVQEKTVVKPIVEKPIKPIKPKKHRLWGMLAGSVLGIFLCGITLMPFAGIMNVVNELNEKPAILIDETNTEDGLITALIKQNADSINIELLGEQITAETIQFLLDNYNNGIGGIFFTYTGAKAISSVTFNELSSVKIGDVKVYLKDDLASIVEVASQAMTLKDSIEETSNGFTVSNLNTIFTKTENILNSAFSIQLIRGVGARILPILEEVVHSTIDNGEFEEDDKLFYKEVVSAVLTNISNNSNAIDSIKEDLLQVIGAVKNLNNPFELDKTKSILTVLLNNSFEEDKLVLLNHLMDNKDSVSNLFNSTLSTRIVSSVLPYGIYYLANYLSDLYDFSLGNAVTLEDFKELEDIETTLTSIIAEMLNLVDSIDYENPSINTVTKDAFICIGKIMDKVSNSLLPDETYANLITIVEKEVASMLPDLNFDGIDLNEAIKGENGILKSLSSIDNWTEEFTTIGTAFDGLFNGENPIIGEGSIDLVRLGAKLDILSTTKLFGGASETSPSKINKILGDAIISFAETNIDSLPNNMDRTESEEALYNIYSYIKDEIGPRLTIVNSNNPNISWENELRELNGLIEFVGTTLPNNPDIFAPIDGGDSALIQLGIEIDKFIASNKSKLITEDDIHTLAAYGIDYLKESLTDGMDSDYFTEVINGIASNIRNIKQKELTLNFENEFRHIEKIYNSIDDIDMEDFNSTCETLGKLFDDVANTPNHSNLITNTELVNLVSGILKDFAKDISGDGIGDAISDLIFSITGKDADNTTTPPTPAIVGTLTDELASGLVGIFDNENKITRGTTTIEFDKTNKILKIDTTSLNLNEKNQATQDGVTYEVFKYNSSSYALRFVELIFDNTDPANPLKYGFWENELTKLGSLTEIADIDLSNMDNLPLVGQKLDDVIYDGVILSGLISNRQIAKLMVDVIVDIKSDITNGLTGTTLNIISDMLGDKTDNIDESIVGNLQGVARGEHSIHRWETELGFLKTLTNIKDLDNTSLTTIGSTLDSIAYNYDGKFNSKVITHKIITNLISNALDVFKPTSLGANDTTNNAIIQAMTSMQTNISALKTKTSQQLSEINFKWETELTKLSSLKNLTIDSTNYKEAGKLTSVGATLDAVAFNENETLNSLIITKEIINTLLADILEIAKSGNSTPTNFDNTISSITNRIEGLEANDYYGRTNFTWAEELGKFEKLLSADFESNDMGELLGNLKFENDGLYYDNQSTLIANAAPIYGNEKDGAGVKLDELINNPDATKNSVLITREIIDELLYNIIDEQSSTLSGDYSDIGDNIKNRLDKTHEDYEEILSYTNELKSINYILDLTKVYNNLDANLETEEMASIGHYFDNISASKLVGDSGANIIILILDAYNSPDNANKPAAIDEINAVVNARVGITDANLIGEIKKNVEYVNDTYNVETNNYETLYRSLGEMKETFGSVLNSIDFNFTFEELTTGNAARQTLINTVCMVSETLEKLQQNEVCLEITSKYIAIYTLDKLIQKLEEIHDEDTYPTGFKKNYQDGLMNYFINDLTREETYFNAEFVDGISYSIPADIVIPAEYDSTDITNSNAQFDYGLIKIVNSYLNSIPVISL